MKTPTIVKHRHNNHNIIKKIKIGQLYHDNIIYNLINHLHEIKKVQIFSLYINNNDMKIIGLKSFLSPTFALQHCQTT
jgi:hypothetical protein